MTDIGTALYNFWNSFGIPAYVEETVPDENPDGTPVTMPYITYRLAKPDWTAPISTYAKIWYRSTSFGGILAMTDIIEKEIGPGAVIPFDNGAIWLYREPQFAQFVPDDDPDVKCMYLNMSMQVVAE